jgi:hypothetical protein
MIGTTYNNNVSNNESSTLDYALTQRLLQINTCLACKILKVNSNKTCDVQSILNLIDANGKPIIPPIQYEVPYIDMVGNNCGFEIEYIEGEIVWVNYSQRDLTNLKSIWNVTQDPSNLLNPNSNRQFNLSDGIIIGRISPKIPTIKVKVTSNGIDIVGNDKPITINTTGDVTANCNNANITATGSTTIISPTINLTGNVIISGAMTCATALIGGLPFATHVHSAGIQPGGYTTPLGGDVSGVSGIAQ